MGVIPVEVMPGLPSIIVGTKYHTGIVKYILKNVIVSMNYFDTKLGGGGGGGGGKKMGFVKWCRVILSCQWLRPPYY